MIFNEWREVQLKEVIQFNPTESIKKGVISKKIGMDKLNPFQRKIEGYELTEFKGGTKFRNGDTLLARITPCLENGKTAQVSILNKNELGFGSTEFIVLRENPGLTVNDFVYYLSISPEIRNISIKSMTGSSGRQRAQIDVIQNTMVLLPPLKEQKSIANILSSLDEKIEMNNQINKKLEEMAQAIFKHWFVDFEFPNEEGNPYKSSGGEMVESELGLIPKGWEVTKVGETTRIIRGASPRPIQDFISEKGMPWVKISDASASNSKYIAKTREFIKEEGVSKSREIAPGTLILSNSATPGIPKIMLIRACVHDGWLIFDEYKGITKEFLYYFLLKEREGILSLSNGSVFRNLKTDILKNYKIIVPSKKTLSIANKLFISINEEIERRTNENDTLVTLRDTLLPKLMSGEIRVPV
ncbi:restriction endonuclease subunit S [Bacillus thuringiensis]|uniref:restriction endonuclease subunit S n=1 Tax=Bacillus thuringiensis TaxID=1428 RepID=UPI000BF6D467|nr:restriction endonuclease subunit S [Bacillus thuringiensis]PFB50942.1 restriction endonuclease subunit S [Bacillus thuringiensis]